MATTAQHPIPSGFDRDSTAEQVLGGIDLTGRLAVVTGGYSGIGIETTRALAGAGAHVVVPARRPDTAAEQLDGMAGTEVAELDLSDLDSVAGFADRLLDDGRGIDVLVDSAGIMATPQTPIEVGGTQLEIQFATNHIGHFALVNRLWPLLAKDAGARVVSVSSRGHLRSPVRFDDLAFEHDAYDKWVAYGQSKTANVLFAVQLDALGQDAGVRAFAVHPGPIMTELQRHLSRREQVQMGWIAEDGTPGDFAFKTPQQGAATQVWAATSSQLDGMGGLYCEDVDVSELAADGASDRGVASYAIDPDNAARLWELSARLTGVDAFA